MKEAGEALSDAVQASALVQQLEGTFMAEEQRPDEGWTRGLGVVVGIGAELVSGGRAGRRIARVRRARREESHEGFYACC